MRPTPNLYADTDYNSHLSYCILEQPDHKILLGGTGYRNFSGYGIELFRLDENGTLDTTFGTDGVAFTYADQSGSAYSLNFQPDGMILAACYSTLSNRQVMTVMRFTSGLPPLEIGAKNENISLNIYPNPFNTDFTIQYPDLENIQHIEILTLDCRQVFSSELTSANHLVHAGFLPTGSYMLRIAGTRNTLIKLIIKI
jgi:hypothetical protein